MFNFLLCQGLAVAIYGCSSILAWEDARISGMDDGKNERGKDIMTGRKSGRREKEKGRREKEQRKRKKEEEKRGAG